MEEPSSAVTSAPETAQPSARMVTGRRSPGASKPTDRSRMLTTLLEMVDTDGFDTSLIEGSRSLGALPSVAEGTDGGGLAQPTLSSTAQESNVSAIVDVLPDAAPKQTVFRQVSRTRAQLKKDQAFKEAQEKRLRRYAHLQSVKSELAVQTAEFAAAVAAYERPVDTKTAISVQGRVDPFTTLRPASVSKSPHHFGASCHEVPLVALQDVPGPGKYSVGIHVEDPPVEAGTALTAVRTHRLQRSFGSEARMSVTDKLFMGKEAAKGQAKLDDFPAANFLPPSSFGRLPEYGPQSTFGNAAKDFGSRPDPELAHIGPGTYNTALSTLKIVPPTAGKHMFGATCHEVDLNPKSITPGPTFGQVSTLRTQRVGSPPMGHTFGGQDRMPDRPATTPGPVVGQLSTIRVGHGFAPGPGLLFSPVKSTK